MISVRRLWPPSCRCTRSATSSSVMRPPSSLLRMLRSFVRDHTPPPSCHRVIRLSTCGRRSCVTVEIGRTTANIVGSRIRCRARLCAAAWPGVKRIKVVSGSMSSAIDKFTATCSEAPLSMKFSLTDMLGSDTCSSGSKRLLSPCGIVMLPLVGRIAPCMSFKTVKRRDSDPPTTKIILPKGSRMGLAEIWRTANTGPKPFL
mmetsp:Transcript_28869/g.96042  ORF Transcript_28869/g.96042 Transcript_28869/m.96042 type:complete len:202 (+) Transcript_28869:206-811(+)